MQSILNLTTEEMLTLHHKLNHEGCILLSKANEEHINPKMRITSSIKDLPDLEAMQLYWAIFRSTNKRALELYPDIDNCKKIIEEYNKRLNVDCLSTPSLYVKLDLSELFLKLIEDKNKYCVLTFVSWRQENVIFQITKVNDKFCLATGTKDVSTFQGLKNFALSFFYNEHVYNYTSFN